VPKPCEIRIQYFPPPAELRRYCTTFFLSEVTVAQGETVEDFMFPEWAALRFRSAEPPAAPRFRAVAEISSSSRIDNARFPVFGPRTLATRFRIGTRRVWSINLSPLGWARFIRQPAHQFANAIFDGYDHPAFASFQPLVDTIFGAEPDPQGELERIIDFLNALDPPQVPKEDRVLQIYLALLDPQLTRADEMAGRLGMNLRTLERTCLKVFGFSPKTLLRRQRFLRSLTEFTLDPSLKWIGAMDALYHDQAQFVRDFREFMGMTPSAYAALDKPIMGAVMRERDLYARTLARDIRRSDQGV
jgi:AraC-like DNA-binding protein